ncbi:hypothetical protein LZQ00_14860 [Sphingobacterium sp. SRCM116780]|uniref:hypothetical protein n=1 Tax=Sphingobacterium sp. SRCM116780 TaxID=2907623 RepID=UPI001F320262|nr:hypothetical protein [Sphingobacterium sp. SRCM116780]UIR55538.1 hypothetical protein LZQ00_14860 [Sphingobacterium sp. SRCM116780]
MLKRIYYFILLSLPFETQWSTKDSDNSIIQIDFKDKFSQALFPIVFLIGNNAFVQKAVAVAVTGISLVIFSS